MSKVIPFPKQPKPQPKQGPDDADLMNAIIEVVEDFVRLRDYFVLIANEPVEVSVLRHAERKQARLDLANRFHEKSGVLLSLVKEYHRNHPQISTNRKIH